ncbi:MAG: redoxin family protein, partial [Planctomycetes bacterium]|nr:redoxin family protein [Planctomycetota bacterium]
MIDPITALNLAADHVWAVGVDVALKATLLFLVALLLHRLLRAHHPVACSSIWNAYLVGLALLPLAAVACPRLRIECLPPDLAVTEASSPAVTGKSVNPPPAPMDGETAHSADWKFEQANAEPFVPAQGTQIPHETSAFPVARVAASEVRRQSVQWKTWFLATYFIGVMIAAVRLALSFRAVKSLQRSSVALTEPSWIDALRGWCRRLAIGRSVRLAHSGEIGTAIVLGWLRPVIVMPRAMLSAITPGQRNVILVHELAHIRRADFAWQWLLRVLQVVYWLHPLCWVTDRTIRSVRERICDDFCVHWLGNRREYQTALVDLAGTMARRQRGLALGLAVRSSKIEQRLAHIDESSGCLRCRPRWQFRTLLLGVAAGLTMLLGSVELCRVNLTAGEVAAERTEPLTVAGEPSDKTPVKGYKLMGEPPLLCVECDKPSAERLPTQVDQAPAGTGDPGTEIFIVSFKGIDPFRPKTRGELLNGFANRHKDRARTRDFRSTKQDGELIGYTCVYGRAGKDSLVSALAENDRVTLVDVREGTPDVLKRHIALGHASPGTSGDPGTKTFIVCFEGIDPFRPQTARDLLNSLPGLNRVGAGVGFFQTTKKDGALVGHICVDGEAGKDSLVSLMAESDRVRLVEWREATPEALMRHMALDQASAGASRARQTHAEDGASLRFELPDAFGRKVHSDDYLGAPVLILAGGCWCGGCQADAEKVRAIEEKYRARGLQVIRSTSLDNELPAWEFQKHYRLPFVQMLDPIREFEKRYNDDGWTFLMLADGEGKIVYRGNSGNLDYSHVEGLLDTLLARRSTVETVSRDGVSYMPATLERSGESNNLRPDARFASVACSAEGRTYVAFTTNHGGTQDVYLREFNGQKWLPDRPVAATEADEFDGTVIVDREDRVWVSWTS